VAERRGRVGAVPSGHGSESIDDGEDFFFSSFLISFLYSFLYSFLLAED
jgi:hypothetical protein